MGAPAPPSAQDAGGANPYGYQYYQPTAANQAFTQANPWSQSYQQDTQAQITNTAQSMQNVSTLQAQMGSYGGGQATGNSSAYPAMQNQWGLGATPGANSSPGYAQAPVTTAMPDSSSRGFNPWSLEGESNARGK